MWSDLWDLTWVSLARLPGNGFRLLSAAGWLVLLWEEDVYVVFTPLGHTAVTMAPVFPKALGGY